MVGIGWKKRMLFRLKNDKNAIEMGNNSILKIFRL
jgi:hypothetical protein